MALKNFIRYFIIWMHLLLAPSTWATMPSIETSSDCVPLSHEEITLEFIEQLTAEECFELGKCEYLHKNFSSAYTFFLSANLKGHKNTPSFNEYFEANKSSLDSLQRSESIDTEYLPSQNIINERKLTNNLEPEGQDVNNYALLLHQLINYLFLFIAIAGFLIATKILFKYRKQGTHTIYLAIFLFGVSTMVLEHAVYWIQDFHYNPRIYFFKIHYFLWPPSLYLYIRKKLNLEPKTGINEILKHYGIFFIFCILLLIAVNSETDIKTTNFRLIINKLLESQFIKSIHCTIYLILLVRLYYQYKNLFSSFNKKWLILAITFLGVLMIIIFSRALYSNSDDFNYISIYFATITLSFFICLYSFMLYLQPDIIRKAEVLTEAETEEGTDIKYKNSGLTDAMTNTLKAQLTNLIETKKVYLDNGITLEKLANELNTDRYSLSQVINQEFEKNFYEFINDYRVQEAVNIIENNKGKIKLVTDLIYESGFNNKVSFYKAFKKRKKMTPTQYIKTKYKDEQSAS
ncbi:MAG: helix-turn-helix domain-containing protein [Arenibacter latericius]|nr:helix-turn-helix domain-containing protein [Arenibacter latericius]